MKTTLQIQQTIAPALQKSLQLLQMNALEFYQEISDALDRNPLLEREDEGGESGGNADDPAADGEALEPVAASAGDDEVGDAIARSLSDTADSASDSGETWQGLEDDVGLLTGDAERDFPIDDGLSGDFANFSSERQTRREGGEDGANPLDHIAVQRPLREHLLEQIGGLRLSELDAALAAVVVDSLDSDGYLRDSPESLHALALDMIVESGGRAGEEAGTVSLADIEIAICRVQSLDPVGVGAASIADSLARQLLAVEPAPPSLTLALTIIRTHLDLLGQGDFRALATVTAASHEQLAAATQLIRSLDPKPGRRFATDRIDYAVPEVIVRKVGRRWEARLHPGATPRIRVNAAYAGVVSRAGSQALSEQLSQAHWLIRSIEQRASTIERTAQAIVARQQRFFEFGDIGMQPMRLADIAQDVGIHESTVSRVVNSKYLQCPRGLIRLKTFFTSHVETSSGDACSAMAVKAMIRQLVDNEGEDPISDHRLAKLLARRGIRIARRTVTKYRDALGIEAVEMRRHAGRSPLTGSTTTVTTH